MSEFLYEVRINGAGSIVKRRVLKETPKTYVLDKLYNKIVRKETMGDAYSRYFVDEEKAKECLENIHRRYERNSIAIKPRLSCAPGDVVYQIVEGKIFERKVLYIRIYESENRYIFDEVGSMYEYITDSNFGKTAFVLKEDAEEALKKT